FGGALGVEVRQPIAVPGRTLLRHGDRRAQSSLALASQLLRGPVQARQVLGQQRLVLLRMAFAKCFKVGHGANVQRAYVEQPSAPAEPMTSQRYRPRDQAIVI